MAESVPVVYLLHGEDDFAVAKFVKELQGRLGDPSKAEMNTTRLDGGSFDLEELRAAAGTMPFLARRRLVILEDPGRKINNQSMREKFLGVLQGLPETTALILYEKKSLDKTHWLLKWAAQAGGRAYIRSFAVPRGPKMAEWIRSYAGERGGEITRQAAALLAETVGDDPRMTALEIDKLLAYVNFTCPVDVDDVETVAAYAGGRGDFFALIDAIARRDGSKAMGMLHILLDEQPPLILFFSLVGHFRLLLQTREVYEGGGQDAAVAKALGIHPYRAKKLTAQAKTLSMQTLENIYQRLHDYDLEIKTGQLDTELALETMIAALTG
ncbi:MAG: DNA polymerase III subunit delta [Anaerolineales bacterium]|nr:MAG: DNA polymerase III subunit delta [Anaerolineales bacterium]